MPIRRKPIFDVETGYRTATVCNTSNIAYQLKGPLWRNPRKEKFSEDEEANALFIRQLPSPWSIKV